MQIHRAKLSSKLLLHCCHFGVGCVRWGPYCTLRASGPLVLSWGTARSPCSPPVIPYTIPLLRAMQDGWAPLMFACQDGHTAVAELLLGRGAAVDAKSNVSSRLVVHYLFIHFLVLPL
jgi:hypothetical protein